MKCSSKKVKLNTDCCIELKNNDKYKFKEGVLYKNNIIYGNVLSVDNSFNDNLYMFKILLVSDNKYINNTESYIGVFKEDIV